MLFLGRFHESIFVCVYYRALEVWGSQEALDRERKKKTEELKRYQQCKKKTEWPILVIECILIYLLDIFSVKRVLKDMRKEPTNWSPQGGLMEGSGKVVLTAILMYEQTKVYILHKLIINFFLLPFFLRNGSNFLFKLVAWLYTGSHSMFSECLHSLADTANQLILAYGIHKSSQVNLYVLFPFPSYQNGVVLPFDLYRKTYVLAQFNNMVNRSHYECLLYKK